MKAATRKLVKGVHVGKLRLLQLLHVEKWELKVGLEDTVERCKQSKDADHDDDNDDIDDSTRSIAIEGSDASVLHGNRLRWPFDLGRVWWSKDMRGILFFSGGINFALFFFHCRSGGKKERDGVLIFLVRVRVCWFFFHCRKIFSSSGKTILLLFFFILDMVRE